jgi:hypothetical protein
MSITDTRLSIGFQRLIIVDNPSVSDFGDSQRGSAWVVERRWRGNYADLEFASEVIEGLSNGYTWWRKAREGLRSGAFDLLFEVPIHGIAGR